MCNMYFFFICIKSSRSCPPRASTRGICTYECKNLLCKFIVQHSSTIPIFFLLNRYRKKCEWITQLIRGNERHEIEHNNFSSIKLHCSSRLRYHLIAFLHFCLAKLNQPMIEIWNSQITNGRLFLRFLEWKWFRCYVYCEFVTSILCLHSSR